MSSRTQVVVSFLCTTGRAMMLQQMDANSCIESCAVGRQVLSYFGITSQPAPVKLTALNPAAVQGAIQGSSPEQIRAAGGLSFYVHGTGQRIGPGGWDGHLVLIYDDPDQTLLDLSLDQANVAAGFNLKPFHGLLDPEFWRGQGIGYEIDGAVVQYQLIDCQAWRSMINWKAKLPMAARIIRELRVLLK